tara:strand:- start:1412 stop:1747 length:336 start_codon:yes stop_codon:yes gene_type:complete
MVKKNNKSKRKYKMKPKKKKANIPKAIREQCWIKTFGEKYKSKCFINWCKNDINVFDFHVGHDKPESKGGTLNVDNLKPICARCNLSMSNNFTIKEWNKLNGKQNVCCIIS